MQTSSFFAGLPPLEPSTFIGRKRGLLVLVEVRPQDGIGHGEAAVEFCKLRIPAYLLLVGIHRRVAIEAGRFSAAEKHDDNRSCQRHASEYPHSAEQHRQRK